RDATRVVFGILSHHVDRGQIEKIRNALPEDVRAIWHGEPDAPDARERPAQYSARGGDVEARVARLPER
ncbi:MAG: hypothetical protein K0S56_2938, partial [Microvirga sp.]|nr:hypothetical protein [Microvirga sp.]